MAPGDDLARLEQQLSQREAQLQAAGYRPMERARSTAGTAKQMDANEGQAGGRCRQVCEITTAICELEGQICGLVPRHPEDQRYQAACSRAADDCRFATEACNACT